MAKWNEDRTWISDDNGNRCSVAYFGSEEAAQKALESLEDCRNCSDCSGCSGCSRCSYCSGCSRCKSTIAPEAEGAPAVPKIENIHAKVYEAASQPNALRMDQWHYCDTTHCRAGWVVTLAGEEGKKLERFFNTELAAMLIYRESGAPINPARFYDGNDDAMADMKRLAESEAA